MTSRLVLTIALAVEAAGILLVLDANRSCRAQQIEREKPSAVETKATTGSIKGKVTFVGSPPTLRPLIKQGDPKTKDAAFCSAADIPNESLLVNVREGNGIANVCIYMQKAPEGYEAPPVPQEAVVFDIQGCRFVPHCLMARATQDILLKSGDPIAHNPHPAPIRAKEFGAALAPLDRVGVPISYNKAERIPVPVRCDLHPWMKAYHLVQDHPFMAITNNKGEFEIQGLPPGEHKFVIWQEIPGYLEKSLSVTVAAGKQTRLDLSYGPEKFEAK